METEVKELTDLTVGTGKPCSDCGADIRAGSLFCYNCGGSVETGEADSASEAKENGDGKVQRFPRSRPRSPRKPAEFTWRRYDGPGYKLLLISLSAALLVGLVLTAAYNLK